MIAGFGLHKMSNPNPNSSDVLPPVLPKNTIRRWGSTKESGAAHPVNNPDHASNYDPEKSAR